MVSRKKFSRVERLSIHESTRTTSNICYMAPTHHLLDPSFLLLTRRHPLRLPMPTTFFPFFPGCLRQCRKKIPQIFLDFSKPPTERSPTNPPPTPSILKTSSVLSSIQNYPHWLPFESNFALISLQRVRSVYLNYILADEALMFPFFFFFLFFFSFFLVWPRTNLNNFHLAMIKYLYIVVM